MRIDPEFQALIPPLSNDEYAALELSIMAEGCRDAIVVWQHDGDDIIVDGHNRYAICTAAGLPYKTVTRDFSSRSEVMLWMIRNQLARRNLTPFKRTELALRMKDVIAEQARTNKELSGAQYGRGQKVSANLHEPIEPITTSKELARIAEVSSRNVHKVQKVLKEAPAHIVDKARAGDISIHVAHALAGQPDEVVELALRLVDDSGDKVAILARLYKSNGKDGSNATFDEIATNGGFHYGDEMDDWCDFAASSARQIEEALESLKKYHKVIERAALIQEQRAAIEKGIINTDVLSNRYNVIVIDPPWNYGTQYDPDGRRVANPYPEMTQSQLINIEIPSADDCVMFLWTTHRFIWDAKELLDQWGFTYRATLVWDKEKIGMGDLFRMQCEFCIVGIKGSPVFDNNHTWRDIIKAPRREHSRKPDEFYAMVDSLCVGLKLDYFSRQQRAGWQTFGNDNNKFEG